MIGADLLLLASDGYGNSFAVADWQDRLVEDFVRGVRRDGFAVLSERLPGWLVVGLERPRSARMKHTPETR